MPTVFLDFYFFEPPFEPDDEPFEPSPDLFDALLLPPPDLFPVVDGHPPAFPCPLPVLQIFYR